jgi:arginine decarboxylase
VKRGFRILYLDLGGGLGVNYTAARTEESSINYSLREYANTIVGTVGEVCEAHDVACPILVTESGRALTAHHSVLIVPVLDVRRRDGPMATKISADAPEPLQALHKVLKSLSGDVADASRLKEAWHVANARMKEVGTLFGLGFLSLEQRALAEDIFWQVCSGLLDALSAVDHGGAPEVEELETLLTDQYLCDFSVFQSMLDHWAIGQSFPIMPIARLEERPTRRGILVDLTCDSDGRVSHYVSGNSDSSFLPLHETGKGESYYLGFFLMGAYEDIVGDAHNLFGRVSEAHVYADAEEPENFWIEKILPGTAIQDILAQVQYFPNDLHRRMSELVREKIREGAVRPKEGIAILDQYMAAFSKNTYCDPHDLEWPE